MIYDVTIQSQLAPRLIAVEADSEEAAVAAAQAHVDANWPGEYTATTVVPHADDGAASEEMLPQPEPPVEEPTEPEEGVTDEEDQQ